MKIVLAPDSFKGTLSSQRICELLEQKIEQILPGNQVISIPVSDGGEGAVDIVVAANKGSLRQVEVSGPLLQPVMATYGIFQENQAIIEMATASGLPLVPKEQLNVRYQSTYGTGQLIADALNQGITKFWIAIGGSATNDGGMGCAHALGVRFLDRKGDELQALPINLHLIHTIDLSQIHPKIKEATFTVMCDVTNPLLGPKGATNVFGPQKGANTEDIVFLESGMTHYAKVLKETFGYDVSSVPGAGAAGGLGAGLMAFANAKLQSGIDTILEILQFDAAIKDADLVVTGEGMMDDQSVYGKVAYGVGRTAKKHGVPCVAIVGGMGKDASNMYDYGVDSIMTTINAAIPIEQALINAEELFLNAAERLFRILRVGMDIK